MTHISAQNISITLRENAVLRDVSFSVNHGEYVALIGPNGAGKTTLLRALAALIEPQSGTLTLNETAFSKISTAQRATQICYLPQDHNVHWPISVRNVVALGRLPYRTALPHLSDEDEQAIDEALQQTDMHGLAERRIDTLSGGEQVRALIARSLATKAPLILADEPIASLDPYHQLLCLELFRSHAKQGGSVVVILHDLALAAQFADRVLLLDSGRLIADGPPQDVLSPAHMEEVYKIRLNPDFQKQNILKDGLWARIAEQ